MGYRHTIKDIMEVAGHKAMPGWIGDQWEAVDEASIVTGGVPDGVYSRGPRKGQPRLGKWLPGTKKKMIVTDAEMDLSAKFYESESGKCYNCKGTGQEYYGWSRESGEMLRTCQRCGGSGNVPAIEEETQDG